MGITRIYTTRMKNNKFIPGLYTIRSGLLKKEDFVWIIFKTDHCAHGIINGIGYCFKTKQWLESWAFQTFVKYKAFKKNL